MTAMDAAFACAKEGLSRLGIPGILPKLEEAGISMRRETLGGSHSVVTYPPLNALLLIIVNAVLRVLKLRRKVGLYVHVVPCESKCTFCHYDVITYLGARHSPARAKIVARYLEALGMEMEWWGKRLRSSGTSVSSIYIGGGTPLVLEEDQLIGLLEKIRLEFHVLPDAEICVEGSPLTITAPEGRAKLRALKEHGVTRFSFGVQSFNDKVLHGAARGYKRDTAIEACRIVGSIFDNWNIDLIQSLYKGTPGEVWENLEALKELEFPPPHITWYHGRLDSNRPQGVWSRTPGRSEKFESVRETLLGRMLLWQELKKLGYQQIDGNRFVRSEHFADPFKKVRTSATSDLLGIGASSYSHFEGYFLRNVSTPEAYIERVEANGVALEKGLPLDMAEQLAASYVLGIRTGRLETEDDAKWKQLLPEQTRYYDDLVSNLLGLGLLEKFSTPSGVVLGLSELGRLFEDEVLSYFYSPRVQELLR